MRKFLVLLISFISLFASDSLDIKILKEVNFSSGYGIVEAEPILKGVREKVKLRGDYNTEQNGNVNFSFSKVEIDGRIYTLSEPFVKKSRLKNPKTAKLSKGSKIQVSEGSRSELLDILNRKREGQSESYASSNKNSSNPSSSSRSAISGATSSDGFISSTGRSSTSSSNPYYYGLASDKSGTGSDVDYSSPTTNSDGTCKAPSIKDGVVSVYSAVAGTCQLLTASEDAIYIKANQPTCQNIVDYENGLIKVGEEKFVTMDDNKEYKVGSCTYTEPIKLSSEIGSCKAIPDYEKGEALIQKQYFYIRNNERINVGGCTPAKEYALLEDDVNSCSYRYDFINNLAIKQTQYFFMAENARQNVGECVDKKGENFHYPLFEDDSTCNYTVSNDRVFYQKRLAFMDLTGGKQFATDCRVIASDGYEILEELSGYEFNDLSKQAIRKVNQYFIIPGTQNVKKYISKDVKTNKAYPYQERLCRWEHNDDEKFSRRLSTIFIQDTDENKEVVIQECSESMNTQIIAYAYAGEEKTKVEEQTGKTLIPDGTGYKIYNTEDFIVNTPNFGRNAPSEKELQYEESRNRKDDTWCGNGAGKIGWNSYTQEQKAGLNLSDSYVSSRSECTGGNSGGGCNYYTTCKATIKAKPNYGINQVLEKSEIRETWIRGDGSKYQLEPRIEWRAK